MKRIIIAGNVGSGKTTLCQFLNNQDIKYKKTQSIEVINTMIDTPGEYFQHRKYLRALVSCSADTEIMIFAVDPTQDQSFLRDGLAATFPMEVIGVITKKDLADTNRLIKSAEMLHFAGVEKIFEVSAMTGEGMKDLADYLA